MAGIRLHGQNAPRINDEGLITECERLDWSVRGGVQQLLCTFVHAPICFCCREKKKESLCFKPESLSEIGSSVDKIAWSSQSFARRWGTENQITLFLIHTDTHTVLHTTRVKRWWEMASQTSWYCVSCLSSQMKWMYPSCRSPPRCSPLSLVFWPTGHIYYPMMNDTENRICAYYSHCTVSAIHHASAASGSYDLLRQDSLQDQLKKGLLGFSEERYSVHVWAAFSVRVLQDFERE